MAPLFSLSNESLSIVLSCCLQFPLQVLLGVDSRVVKRHILFHAYIPISALAYISALPKAFLPVYLW